MVVLRINKKKIFGDRPPLYVSNHQQMRACQIMHLTSALYDRGRDSVTVWWVPGHSGVTGNDMAALSARQAAEESRASQTDRKGVVSMQFGRRRRTERAVR